MNLLNNYFFFAGQAVFLIIYFFCMLAGHAYKIGPRKFALRAGETLLGCAMGCVLLLLGENDSPLQEADQGLVKTAAGFLGKQMEN